MNRPYRLSTCILESKNVYEHSKKPSNREIKLKTNQLQMKKKRILQLVENHM